MRQVIKNFPTLLIIIVLFLQKLSELTVNLEFVRNILVPETFLSLNSHSSCMSFSMESLVKFNIPSNLTFSNFDALFQFNPWFTEAHMETGGKNSISYTPIGKTLFIICERGMKSNMLEKHIRIVYNIIRFVKAGPPPASSQSKDYIKYYIPHSPHFLCQPAFCVHSVMTFTTGPFLVLGWEACDKADTKRAERTLRYYGNGLRNSSYKRLLEIQGPHGAVE